MGSAFYTFHIGVINPFFRLVRQPMSVVTYRATKNMPVDYAMYYPILKN